MAMMLAAAWVLFRERARAQHRIHGGTMVQIGFKSLPPIEDIRKNLDAAGWQGYTLQTSRKIRR